MKPIMKKIAREIRAALPFALINTKTKSDLGKILSYDTVEEAKAAGFDASISNTNVSSLSSPIKTWPNLVSSDYDSRYISIVDLDNHKCVWDWQVARNEMKTTSWYNELGPPPTHGIFVVNNAGTSIRWLDRESPTLQTYMTFECSLNNMVALNPISSIYFLDFKLYVVGTGQASDKHVFIIDFLRDERITFTNSGMEIYSGNVTQRNIGNSNTLISDTNPLPAVTTNIRDIKAIRIYDGAGADYLGRPKHSWLVTGETNILAAYNAQRGELFESNDMITSGTAPGRTCDLDYNGRTLYTYRTGGSQTFIIGRNINTITNNSSFNALSIRTWNYDFKTNPPSGFLDNVAFINSPLSRIYKYGGSVLLGTDQGLSTINWEALSPNAYQPISYITTTSSFITPYVKGAWRPDVNADYGLGNQMGAWPLNDLNDRSILGWNLTNTGSVTFNNDGPFGFKCATFNGSNHLEATTPKEIAATDGFTISLMVKTTNTSNSPIVVTVAANTTTQQNTNRIQIGINSSGYVYFYIYDHSGNNIFSGGTSGPVDDGRWHHIALTLHRTTGIATLYTDTKLQAAANASSITSQFAISGGGQIRIGAHTDDNTPNWFNGDIAMVSFSSVPWELEEVCFEYERMQSALTSTHYLLAADDIDSIKVDRESDRAIITAGNSAHIMNTKNGLITDRRAISSGTLLDADIINVEGSDNPHYVLAGDTSIEQVAPSNTIGARQ